FPTRRSSDLGAADHQCFSPGSTLRPGLRAPHRAPDEDRCRVVEFIRLRWYQRRFGVPQNLNRICSMVPDLKCCVHAFPEEAAMTDVHAKAPRSLETGA